MSRRWNVYTTRAVPRVVQRGVDSLSVPCPRCRALPNTPCSRPAKATSRPIERPHAARLLAARSKSL